MRLVYFFALSLALHAAALCYPVLFAERSNAAAVIRVTIAPISQEENNEGGGGIPPPAVVSKTRASKAVAAKPAVEAQSVPVPTQQGLPIETNEKVNVNNVDLDWPIVAAEHDRNVMPISTSVSHSGVGGRSSGADHFGSPGAGSGRGSGIGNGTGASRDGIVLTQVRYRTTPRPEYPEDARRAGREGRVLLRVLVDDQGRSQQVEINRSSGSDLLDRAAVDAIKNWRFYPARYGDRAIESWIKIPIEFALANADMR